METKYDKNLNQILFGVDYQSDYSEEESEKIVSMAEELINRFGEKTVFSEWCQYLEKSVDDKRAAYNFMIAFFGFGGQNFKIADPYPFLTQLFWKLGLSIENEPDKMDKDMFDTFDSIYTSMLIKSGLASVDDYFELNLFKDKKFIEGISKLESPKS